MSDAREIAAGLTKAQRDALKSLPGVRLAHPERWQAARPFSSLWRKSSQHYQGFIELESLDLVERKVSRAETLWRPTKAPGLAVRAILTEGDEK